MSFCSKNLILSLTRLNVPYAPDSFASDFPGVGPPSSCAERNPLTSRARFGVDTVRSFPTATSFGGPTFWGFGVSSVGIFFCKEMYCSPFAPCFESFVDLRTELSLVSGLCFWGLAAGSGFVRWEGLGGGEGFADEEGFSAEEGFADGTSFEGGEGFADEDVFAVE